MRKVKFKPKIKNKGEEVDSREEITDDEMQDILNASTGSYNNDKT